MKAVFFFCLFPFLASAQGSLDSLIRITNMIDCEVNYYVRVDSNCQWNCDHAPFPGIRPYNFGEIKSVSGINSGVSKMRSLASMVGQRNSVINNTLMNAKVIYTADDLMQAQQEEKHGIIFYIQTRNSPDEWQLNGEVNIIEDWYNEGLRVFNLAYGELENHGPQEKLGYGTDSHDSLGMTILGREAIDQMNRLGMIVDVSHCNRQTTLDACCYSRVPVFSSHSNSRTICDVDRNKTDEELISIASTGGVIGISAIRGMLVPWPEFSDIDDYIQHIDYVVNLVGIDHVGMSSDSYLDGWDREGHYPGDSLSGYGWQQNVLHKLHHELGYTFADLKKIMGGNFIRMYKEIELNKGQKPSVFSLAHPEDASMLHKDSTYHFQWEKSRDAQNVNYFLQLTGPGIDTIIETHEEINFGFTINDDFTVGEHYKWSVTANNPIESRDSKDTFSFRVRGISTNTLHDDISNNVFIHPNPTYDSFIIEVAGGKSINSIHLYNVEGFLMSNRIFNQTNKSVISESLNIYNTGIYLLRINFDDGTSTYERIVKM